MECQHQAAGTRLSPHHVSSASLFTSLCLSFSSAKIGIKLPLTSHGLVEGLNGIMDAKAHCELLNPYTNVILPGALENHARFQTYAAGLDILWLA